jgi:ATP-dependent helicase/nuclease subunit B
MALSSRHDDSGFWDFWWPRFERIAAWTVETENEWRAQAENLAVEAKGFITIESGAGPFTLNARADRIDRRGDGTLAVIDYKSGGNYKAGKIKSGDQPQLPLEALILQQGGFTGIPAAPVSWLGYWLMTGGREPGKIEAISGAGDIIEEARAGLEALIRLYDDEAVPYYSVPHPARAPAYNNYGHLARIEEWAALDDVDTEAA